MLTADVCVVGAGVIGLNICRELRRRYPSLRLVLLEKEPAPCLHGSGRNSGMCCESPPFLLGVVF